MPVTAPDPGGIHRPDDPEFVDRFAAKRGAYLHIPFCARICPYCDFAVVEGAEHLVERYIAAVEREIGVDEPWEPLQAVFVGGGTPSHVEPGYLGRLLDALDRRHGIESGAEISMEANPEDWSGERARGWRRVGINRVSFGAQSLNEPTLTFLGRRHRPEQVLEAVAASRAAGFDSVSVDLIFGSPDEPLAVWEDTVAQIGGLEVDHVSAYALTVERGTPLSRAVAAGAPAPDPDAQADAYDHVRRALAEANMVHYEVSNWARPGHACAYNLIVWAGGEYLAYGLGAHRHRAGRRSWNLRRFDAYLERGGIDVESGSETLDPAGKDMERIIVGLRRRAGVIAGPLGRRWAATPRAGSASTRAAKAVATRAVKRA